VAISNLRIELGKEDIRFEREKCLIVLPYRYISSIGKNKQSLLFFLNNPDAAVS
jgi:hypothetical protein